MRSTSWAIASLAVAIAPAVAADAEMVAIKPGLMCSSADALAKLTLPNGDSRTHLPGAKAQDLSLAASGGCIDIPLGATVTVQQAFKNTSIVAYGNGGTSPYIVPNIDFRPASSAVPEQSAGPPGGASSGLAVPPGYRIAQLIPAGSGGSSLLVLEDQRITPALREQMWGRSDDPDVIFRAGSAQATEFARRPFLNARLLLVSAAAAVLAERRFERPLASVEPAPLHGMPAPTFLLSIDYSSGMGSYSGPGTELLVPSQRRLDPVEFNRQDGGRGGILGLANTLKSAWKIVPSRSGPTEEIEAVQCRPENGGDNFVTIYRTYRFRNGQWTSASRQVDGFWEADDFPPRSAFP